MNDDVDHEKWDEIFSSDFEPIDDDGVLEAWEYAKHYRFHSDTRGKMSGFIEALIGRLVERERQLYRMCNATANCYLHINAKCECGEEENHEMLKGAFDEALDLKGDLEGRFLPDQIPDGVVGDD